MQIWQMEPFPCGDRRLPHHMYPPKILTPDQVANAHGITWYKVDISDTNATKKRISRVKAELKVTSSDVVTINTDIVDFEQKMDKFYEPITREDDLIILVIDGSAYYDIQIDNDEWIRINVEKGDLLVIPRGLCHRFTLTPQNIVVMQRFFQNKSEMAQG